MTDFSRIPDSALQENISVILQQFTYRMISLLIIVFVIGYAAIALEHPLKINKSGTALVLAVLCWLIYLFTGSVDSETLTGQLAHHLSGISEILFFLMGAMTIVELIDAYKGFNAVTNLIQTNNKTTLLWVICFITFFLSAILDNLTTSIVMVSLLRKLISEKKERMIFASMVIIAANSGGAWSPIWGCYYYHALDRRTNYRTQHYERTDTPQYHIAAHSVDLSILLYPGEI